MSAPAVFGDPADPVERLDTRPPAECSVRMAWHVYIVRCADDTLYTGITVDLEARLRAHNAGIGAKYTARRLPVELVYTEVPLLIRR